MAKVPRHDIATAVLNMLQAGQPLDQVAASLAAYLVGERRSRELDALMRDIETKRYKQDGVLEANVASARELNEAVRQAIQQLLPGRQVQMHYQLSPALVGGVKVQALDKQLDLTIQSKLKRLKRLTTSSN